MTHPNATADPDADHSVPIGQSVIRYPNRNGAIVEVFAADYPRGTASGSVSPSPDANRAARCHGCGETRATIERGDLIGNVRTWAAKHADQCRALPQQTGEASARSECLETAARLLNRAEGIVFTGTGTPRLLNAADHSMVNTLARLTSAAAALAGAYQAESSAGA